jgi:hypothetical protein
VARPAGKGRQPADPENIARYPDARPRPVSFQSKRTFMPLYETLTFGEKNKENYPEIARESFMDRFIITRCTPGRQPLAWAC